VTAQGVEQLVQNPDGSMVGFEADRVSFSAGFDITELWMEVFGDRSEG
jgi:hypothetical protein